MGGKWIEYRVGAGTLAIANVGAQWTPSDQGTGNEHSGGERDVGDRAALARTLDDLLGRNGGGSDLGRAGRLYALSAFAPESAARRYAEIYQQVIGAHAS